jgi:hypothetical protein
MPVTLGSSAVVSDGIFWQNAKNVTTNQTVSTTYNAMSIGPITVNSGVTVTISSGAVWVII